MYYDSAYDKWTTQWSTSTSTTSYINNWYSTLGNSTVKPYSPPKPKEPKISNEELMKLFEPEA